MQTNGKKAELVRIIKFGIVGVSNTLVNMIVFFLLVTFCNLPGTVSQGVGYTAGILNSFICNRRFTFRDQKGESKLKEFVPFVIVNLVTLGVSVGLMAFVPGLFEGWFPDLLASTGMVKIYEYLAQLCVVPVTLVLNFIGSRLFVWKKPSQEVPAEKA